MRVIKVMVLLSCYSYFIHTHMTGLHAQPWFVGVFSNLIDSRVFSRGEGDCGVSPSLRILPAGC